jgi:uncharacterized protein
MQYRILDERSGRRVFAVILETSEIFPEKLIEFARDKSVRSGWLTALGAFSDATVAFWDPVTKEYLRIGIREQVEVVSLVGNIAVMPDNSQRIHAHAVLGQRDGSTRGGHLIEGRVLPTLEVFLMETGDLITRRVDDETGLPLIRFDRPSS